MNPAQKSLRSQGLDPASDPAANRLAAVFTDVFRLPPDRVHPGLAPADVERWDSVGHVMLVTAVEQAFAIQFDVDEIMEFTNFQAILSAIERRMAA
jgi:acyl carrier protein